MYKLNYFNFEEKNNKYLITNDIGEYEFLSKENFKKLLQKMKLESNVEENLLKKGFIYKEKEEIFATKQAMKLRYSKGYLLIPTSLHIFVVLVVVFVSPVLHNPHKIPGHPNNR